MLTSEKVPVFHLISPSKLNSLVQFQSDTKNNRQLITKYFIVNIIYNLNQYENKIKIYHVSSKS